MGLQIVENLSSRSRIFASTSKVRQAASAGSDRCSLSQQQLHAAAVAVVVGIELIDGMQPARRRVAAPGGRLRVDVNRQPVLVEPRAEWRQMYREAWRINRDFFYAPNMHGVDWAKQREKYAAFLPHVTTRADLNRVLTDLADLVGRVLALRTFAKAEGSFSEEL